MLELVDLATVPEGTVSELLSFRGAFGDPSEALVLLRECQFDFDQILDVAHRRSLQFAQESQCFSSTAV